MVSLSEEVKQTAPQIVQVLKLGVGGQEEQGAVPLQPGVDACGDGQTLQHLGGIVPGKPCADRAGSLIGGEDLRTAGAEVQQPGLKMPGQTGNTGLRARGAVGMGQVCLLYTSIQPGMFVTMDFGCVYEGYCSDMTRTVAVGQPTEEMERVYHTVLEAQRAGIAAARAGVTGSEVDRAARQVIQQAGYGAFFSHSFGHSLGLEIHESPNASPSEQSVLPTGAVISAEPGIYLPGRFGVRIEDVLVLREGGCEDITHSPKNLIVL